MPDNHKIVILPLVQLPTLPIIPSKRTKINVLATNKLPPVGFPSSTTFSAFPTLNNLATKPIQSPVKQPLPAPAIHPLQRKEQSSFLYGSYTNHHYIDMASPPLSHRPGSASNTWIPASTIQMFLPGNAVPSIPRVSLTSIKRGRKGNRWKARSILPRRIASDQVPTTFAIPPYCQNGPRSGLNKVIPIPRPLSQNADSLAASRRSNYGKSGTGAISPNHTFTSDATLQTMLVLLLRYGGLSIAQLYLWKLVCQGWCWLINAWLLSSTYSPAFVQHWRPDQRSIPASRIAKHYLARTQL